MSRSQDTQNLMDKSSQSQQERVADAFLTSHAEELKKQFSTSENLESLFDDVFGNNLSSSEELVGLRDKFVSGTLRPEVKFVSPQMLTDAQGRTRNAAFDRESQTILLSESLDAAGIKSSIQQELGHWWDAQLNGTKDTTTAKGTPFDEGTAYAERFAEGTNGDNIFSNVVYQDDSQTILVNGQATDVEFRPIATWNIQGGTNTTSNGVNRTWNNVLNTMNNPGEGLDPIEVMAIQEAGNPGASIGIQPTAFLDVGDGTVVQYDLERDGSNFRIYWTLGGIGGGGSTRTSLAIVLRNPPDASEQEIFWLSNPTSTQRRPILGVSTGDKLYFSVHATSGGGPDSEAILSNILGGSDVVNQFIQTSHLDPNNIFVLGDFNRNIASTNNPAQFPASQIGNVYNDLRFQNALVPPDATTQNARRDPTIRTLDYMFTEAPLAGIGQGFVLDQAPTANTNAFPSDHFPVVYDDEVLPSLNGNKVKYAVRSNDAVQADRTVSVGEGLEVDNFGVNIPDLTAFDLNFIGADDSNFINRISYKTEATSSGTFDSGGFNGLVFKDLGNNGDLPAIQNVSIPNLTNTLGINAASTVSFSQDSISVNLQGVGYNPGDGFELEIDYGSV